MEEMCWEKMLKFVRGLLFGFFRKVSVLKLKWGDIDLFFDEFDVIFMLLLGLSSGMWEFIEEMKCIEVE